MGHALAEQHFDCYEEVGNWVSDWFALKDEQFYWHGIHKLPERWSKCVICANTLIKMFLLLH